MNLSLLPAFPKKGDFGLPYHCIKFSFSLRCWYFVYFAYFAHSESCDTHGMNKRVNNYVYRYLYITWHGFNFLVLGQLVISLGTLETYIKWIREHPNPE